MDLFTVIIGFAIIANIAYSIYKMFFSTPQIKDSVRKDNAERFMFGMSETTKEELYRARTFTRGFSVAKLEDKSIAYIKQAKLTDSGLLH